MKKVRKPQAPIPGINVSQPTLPGLGQNGYFPEGRNGYFPTGQTGYMPEYQAHTDNKGAESGSPSLPVSKILIQGPYSCVSDETQEQGDPE